MERSSIRTHKAPWNCAHPWVSVLLYANRFDFGLEVKESEQYECPECKTPVYPTECEGYEKDD